MKKIFSIILLIFVSSVVFGQTDRYSKGERTEQRPHVSKFSVTPEKMPYILSTPYVDTSYKIYDYAELLSESQRRDIQKRCREFVNKTGLDIAIVTLNENPKQAYKEYAPSDVYIQDFYDYNDFRPDGVMLIIDQDYGRNRYYDAGLPYERYFMGSNVEIYAEQMKPLYQSGRYYDEIMWFINNVEEDYLYDISFPIIKCSIFALLFALLFWGIHRSKYKLKRLATSANNYKKEGSFRLTQNRTDFVKTFTTKTYSPKSSGSSHSGHGSSGGGHSGGGF